MNAPIFKRFYPPTPAPDGEPFWLVFCGNDVVVAIDQPPALLEDLSAFPEADIENAWLLGTLGGRACRILTLPGDAVLPSGLEAVGLRALLARSEPSFIALADYAAQLLNWARTSRFCPACGQPLGPLEGTWGRICAACGHSLYPPVSPAIIVLIHEGDRVLLTTKPGWGQRYSLVAGFVEPGETFEECVVREVREEVGVEVDQIQYIKSQSWPFPHQIMVGFLAHYAGGEIEIDAAELADARWFARDALPELPPPYTISRQLIELWRNIPTPESR